MGGMQSLAAGWLYPERVGKIVSISGTARSSPSAIAMRFAQRSGTLSLPLSVPLSSQVQISSNGRSKLEQGFLLRRSSPSHRYETRQT
jgi:pimeloyl-ACP methyl ester carboxylesterase